jgi:diguanylate cyclase (GGDEF)-like protein
MSRCRPLRWRLLAWLPLGLLHTLACAAPAADMPWSRWMLDGHERPAEVLERWSAAAPELSDVSPAARRWWRQRGLVAAGGAVPDAAEDAMRRLRAWYGADRALAAADAALIEAVQAERLGRMAAIEPPAGQAEAAYAQACAQEDGPDCDPWIWWRLMRLRAAYAEARGLGVEARGWQERAAELAQRQGEPGLQAWALSSLAVLLQGLGEPEAARARMAQAERLSLRDTPPELRLRVRLNQARLEDRRGEAGAALHTLEESWRQAEALPVPRLQALLLANLSDLRLRAGRTREALAAVDRALPLVRAHGDGRFEPLLLFNGGLARLALGQLRAGRADLAAALQLWEQAGAQGPLREALRQGGDALHAAGDHREALDWMHRERALAESLDAANRESALRALRQRQGREAEQQELDRLADENRLAEARLSSQQWQRRVQWLLGGSLLAMAVLLGLLMLRTRAGNRLLQRRTVRLERLGGRDPLTGLANRRRFLEALAPQLQAPQGFQGALMLVDVDHFKQVNDRHGHATGDAVLRAVAQRLARGLRGQDLVCRWGGEEFLIAAPGMGPDAAEAAAQRLLQLVADEPVAEGLTVTLSIGVLVLPLPGDAAPSDWDTALARADLALYAAKDAGRDAWVRVLSVQADSAADRECLASEFEQARVRGLVALRWGRRAQADGASG